MGLTQSACADLFGNQIGARAAELFIPLFRKSFRIQGLERKAHTESAKESARMPKTPCESLVFRKGLPDFQR